MPWRLPFQQGNARIFPIKKPAHRCVLPPPKELNKQHACCRSYFVQQVLHGDVGLKNNLITWLTLIKQTVRDLQRIKIFPRIRHPRINPFHANPLVKNQERHSAALFNSGRNRNTAGPQIYQVTLFYRSCDTLNIALRHRYA